MSGLAFSINFHGLNQAINTLEDLASIEVESLLETVGGMAESFARERLEESKESPDGKPWGDWSDPYARTRHGGHSLLDSEGNLIDSLSFITGSNYVSVGSPLIYSAAHQFGFAPNNLEARPYLGLSDENEEEITQAMNDFIGDLLNA